MKYGMFLSICVIGFSMYAADGDERAECGIGNTLSAVYEHPSFQCLLYNLSRAQTETVDVPEVKEECFESVNMLLAESTRDAMGCYITHVQSLKKENNSNKVYEEIHQEVCDYMKKKLQKREDPEAVHQAAQAIIHYRFIGPKRVMAKNESLRRRSEPTIRPVTPPPSVATLQKLDMLRRKSVTGSCMKTTA